MLSLRSNVSQNCHRKKGILVKIIIQEESSGCGLACVAMLAGRSYQDVKIKANQMGIFAEDEKLWSETIYVRELLKEYGIKVSAQERKFTSWEALPALALISIKYRIENNRPLWHWVVFCGQGDGRMVLDPAAYLESNERKDFENMSPEWFIEIHKS